LTDIFSYLGIINNMAAVNYLTSPIRRVKKIFLLIVFLFVFTTAVPQKLRFDHLTVKEHLSQNNVWDIHEDKLGFIWVATEDGLNVYNGYDFFVYRTNPADSSSISGNYIDCIAEDKTGEVWIGTQNGLNHYDRVFDRFDRFLHDPNDPFSISSNNIEHIYFDSKNMLWVSTVNGLNRYDPGTKKWTRFLHDPQDSTSLADYDVECVIEDGMKRIWAGTRGGLCLLNPDGKTFTNFHPDSNDPTSISSGKIMCLYEDKDRFLWIGTFDGGLNKMHPVHKTFTPYRYDPSNPSSIGNNYVYHLTENRNGELWLATDGALCSMNKKSGLFTRFTSIQGDETGLNSNTITKVLFDKTNRMWVGTRFGGLNIYDKEKYGFEHYKFNSFDKSCLSHNNVSGIEENKNGDFWIATDGGSLNHFNRKTGIFTHYMDVFSNNKLLAIAQDEKENLWVGMWAGGLNYLDRKTNKVKKYLNDPNNPRSLSDNNIFDIMVAKDGTVWIGTWGNGLSKYNPTTDDFTNYLENPNDKNSFSGSPISYLLEDSKGRIFIATEQNGFDIFDPQTNTFTHYKGGSAPGELSGNSVLCFYEDSKNRIWVGTNGAGLNLFDEESKTFTTFRQKDGLPNDAILAILEDSKGELWISTNKGLCRLNPETKKFKNYTESDGLQGDQFNRWASCKLTSTGELVFGGPNGFNIFLPDNIKENANKPPVYITDFKLFNKSVAIGKNEVLKNNILLTKEIELQHNQNIISFEFIALNLRQPEKNQYRYKLEGFDEDWVDAGGERKKEYTNLSPGEYNFRVIGSNNDGLWNEEGASVKIIIVPPFWKTWWFTIGVLLLIIYSILFYIRYQKRKAKQQAEELKSIIEEKTSALREQNQEILKKAEVEKMNNWITAGLATVSETLSQYNSDMNSLGRETLKSVVKYVEAQQGIIALGIKENQEDEHLEILATYGVSKEHVKENRIEIGNGLLGETYKDKEKKVLDTLPKNYLKIQSGLGESLPSKIILLPLQTQDGEMVGVMEVAFLGEISPMVIAFLEKVSSMIALNFFAATLTHKTIILLQQSKEQTEELRAQEEEMRQNMEELEATTEEFRRREIEYQKKIIDLESALTSSK
jgi:ligand-binding sensor domain-containing protein